MKPQGTPENGYMWQRANSQLSSPSQPYSLREALAQAQSSRIGASTQALRESLHPILRQKLVSIVSVMLIPALLFAYNDDYLIILLNSALSLFVHFTTKQIMK